MFLSIFLGLLVYYLMYIACQYLWTKICFGETYSGIINDHYFFYVNYSELIFFIFIRTRSSIKYAPKYLTILNIIYLFYVHMYIYPAVFEAFIVLTYATLFIFCWFIVRYEVPSVNDWNQCGSYTPSESNPRCGYHHILVAPVYNFGFDLIPLFFPLHSEETFP